MLYAVLLYFQICIAHKPSTFLVQLGQVWPSSLVLYDLHIQIHTFCYRFIRVKIIRIYCVPFTLNFAIELLHIINHLLFWNHYAFLLFIIKIVAKTRYYINIMINIYNRAIMMNNIISINNQIDMNLARCLLLLGIVLLANSVVVVNPISGITANNLMFTGTVGVGNQKLFFTFYGKSGENNADNLKQYPLVISVGAPGRSAQYSNVLGFGPKLLTKQLTLADNPNSITQFANVMFLDLLASGFSFASSSSAIPKTSKDYGVMLTKAVNTFNTQADIGKSKKVYIIGQSTFLRVVPGLDDINSLQGIVHVSGWFDLYGTGKYYGTGGVQLKIFTDSQRITIDSTFANCYNFQRSSKFNQSHSCYDTTLNYVESRTKNRNLYNIKLQSNLSDYITLVQYYFSQSSVAKAYMAPYPPMFQTNAPEVQYTLYEDLARNVDVGISQYLKDYLSVKHTFITADNDFVVFRKGTRNWLQNTVSFVESAKFKPLNLTEYIINDKVVAYKKAVNQIAYYQVLDAGHYTYYDQPAVVLNIIKQFIGVSVSKSLKIE